MNDLDRIREIEQTYGYPMMRIKNLMHNGFYSFKNRVSCYYLDEKGKVVGLYLDGPIRKRLYKEVILAFPYLEELSFRGVWVESYSFLKEIKNLKFLNLSSAKLTNLEFLKELKELNCLGLHSNQLNDISYLEELKKIQTLDLSSNQVTDINFLQELKGLTFLDLHLNQIKDISCTKELKEIQSLNLSSNKITNINSLVELKKLRSLDLSSNQISDINILKELKKLTSLNLHLSRIVDASFLKELRRLRSLNLSFNQITDISFLKNLTQLRSINLSHNQIKNLPEWIVDFPLEIDIGTFFTGGGTIDLNDNPIISPPIQTIKEGNEAIKAWFSQAEKYGIEKVYEAKILIVGEPNAGKTSLINKILDENYPIPGKEKEKSTLGVEVRKTDKFKYSKDPKIKITSNFWDFGGQDIQYALHQYFITSEALYILVSDYRSETTRFSYWFNTISLLGSKQSRVIVLLNKFKDISSASSFDIASYRRDFPDLNIELIEVDLSENDARWLALKELIQRKIEELPVIGQDSIKIYKSIREEIENKINAGIHYLTLQELCKLAENVGMQSENDTIIMLDYFHKIGLVIYFPDDTSLQNDVFLNPNWITRAIYDALSDKNLEHINGQFEKKWIFDFWKNKNYKEYECIKLLNLMQRNHFDLCYPLPSNKNNYIVPLLLPDKIPSYNWNKTKNLQLRYIYEQFMPEGILSQFIVRMHEYIALEDNSQLVWKKGVILERKNTKAEIIEHTNGREIRIRLNGENINELKGMIMDNFDSIVSRFPKQPDIKIPCNCSTCENLPEPHFFSYSHLLERKSKGVKSAGECENSYEPIKISDILEEYEVPLSEREKIVADYLSTKDVHKFIEGFHKLIRQQYAARFFKNANESTYHALLFDWLKQFSSLENYDILIEVNSPNGEIDLLVKTFPNAKVPFVIKDIFEFKYIAKNSTDTKFENELADARVQANNYRVGEYKDYRAISVVFRGNKDFKIAID